MSKKETDLMESIKVKVCWFSVLAEHRGTREETIQFPGGTTAGSAVIELSDSLPALSKFKSSLRIAVNKEYVTEETVLQHGDELAFITPVSGG